MIIFYSKVVASCRRDVVGTRQLPIKNDRHGGLRDATAKKLQYDLQWKQYVWRRTLSIKHEIARCVIPKKPVSTYRGIVSSKAHVVQAQIRLTVTQPSHVNMRDQTTTSDHTQSEVLPIAQNVVPWSFAEHPSQTHCPQSTCRWL